VLDAFADRSAENVEDDLSYDEHENSKENVSQWPPLLQSAENQDKLHDEIDSQEDSAEDVDHNEHSDRILWAEASDIFESQDADREADEEHDKGADSEKPNRESGAVLV